MTIYSQRAKYRPIVCIDSSGSFMKQLVCEGNKSGYICLHQAIAYVPNNKNIKTIPVTQMVSARQDVNKMQSWLKESFKNSPIPPEVVIDGSAALSNAVSLAFNGKPYKMYLQDCFQHLINQSVINLRTYIRLDRANLIKAVTRWK